MSIYDSWRVEKWETPITLLRPEDIINGVMLQSMTYRDIKINHELELTLSAKVNNSILRYRFNFEGPLAFRNIKELYSNTLWTKGHVEKYGNTWKVTQSDLLKTITEDDAYVAEYDKAEHYVFITELDVVEVISMTAPTIETLAALSVAT